MILFLLFFLLKIASSQRPSVFSSEYRRINSALGYLHVLSFNYVRLVYESQALIMFLIIETSCYKYITHGNDSSMFRLHIH